MRQLAVHADRFGIDPVRDKMASDIAKIVQYSDYTVSQDDVGNIPLVAFDHYNDVELYFVILEYNGIGNMFDIKAGDVIRIPDKQAVKKLFAQSLKSNNKPGVKRTARI